MNVSQALGGSGSGPAARQIERCQCVARWKKVEWGGGTPCADPAPLQDWSEVNLDFALWFILKLSVSFFWSASAAHRVTTGSTHHPLRVCVCVCALHGGWGRLFKKSLVQPDKCDLYSSLQIHVWVGNSFFVCRKWYWNMIPSDRHLDYTQRVHRQMSTL